MATADVKEACERSVLIWCFGGERIEFKYGCGTKCLKVKQFLHGKGYFPPCEQSLSSGAVHVFGDEELLDECLKGSAFMDMRPTEACRAKYLAILKPLEGQGYEVFKDALAEQMTLSSSLKEVNEGFRGYIEDDHDIAFDHEIEQEIGRIEKLYHMFVDMDWNSYLMSPVDFGQKIERLDVHLGSDGRWLFAMPFDRAIMKVKHVKEDIVNRINYQQKQRGVAEDELLTLDKFYLSPFPFVFSQMADGETIELNRVYFGIKMMGGVKKTGMKRDAKLAVTKTKANQKAGDVAKILVPDDIFVKCTKRFNEMTTDESGEWFEKAIGGMNRASLDLFYTATKNCELKITEETVPKIAMAFIPELDDINKSVQKGEALMEAMTRAFVHQYAMCFYVDGSFTHPLYKMIEAKEKDLENEEKFREKYGITDEPMK